MNLTRAALIGAAALLTIAPLAAASTASAQPESARSRCASRPTTSRSTATPQGQLVSDLSTPDNAQAKAVAEVIQRTDPDVVLLNEFDYVEGGAAVDLFRDNYLEVAAQRCRCRSSTPTPSSHPSTPVSRAASTSTTTAPSVAVTTPSGSGCSRASTAWSSSPSTRSRPTAVRTFQKFLWKDMPGNVLPTSWYSPQEQDILRLSSKSHWDVPSPSASAPSTSWLRTRRRRPSTVRRTATAAATTTRSASGPTTSRRARVATSTTTQGARGGLNPSESFVILGDYNADPADGDSYDGAIHQLLGNRRIVDPQATSEGAVEAARLQGGANLTHEGDPKYDTADFADGAPGNLRVDYTLLSRSFTVRDAGVFWPVLADPLSRLTGVFPFPTSDHRLVWADVTLR